jgi:hypothetical protein
MQTSNSQAKLLPSTLPTGTACTTLSLPNSPPLNNIALLSISLRFNRIQKDICQQPHLCDKALILEAKLLDQVLIVKDLNLALKQPQLQKLITSFLYFVFKSSSPLDKLALNRKLKL